MVVGYGALPDHNVVLEGRGVTAFHDIAVVVCSHIVGHTVPRILHCNIRLLLTFKVL